MIRDQFQDVKKVTAKEARKKASMGERTYYAKTISRLQDANKSVGISMIITTVIMAIAYALVLALFIFTRDAKPEDQYDTWRFVVWTVLFAVCLIFTLVWYLAIKPANAKKIERYRHELERLNALNISKASGVYAVYGKEYMDEQIRKYKEEKEKTERLAREKVEDGNITPLRAENSTTGENQTADNSEE